MMRPFEVIVRVIIRDLPSPSNLAKNIPAVIVYFRWAFPNGDDISTFLNVDYRPNENPQSVSMATLQPGVNGFSVSLKSVFIDDELRGRYTNQIGTTGTYVLKRTAVSPEISKRIENY